jgi:hypothetical protein
MSVAMVTMDVHMKKTKLIKEVDLWYEHLDVFTMDISINGLKPGFLNIPYFELSEVAIMH